MAMRNAAEALKAQALSTRLGEPHATVSTKAGGVSSVPADIRHIGSIAFETF
jgi:hypothetical protein